MSPQFVDFNGDGKLDIVAGIFDGSPHVALGGDKGWAQPEQILDRDGQRIVMNDFWNFDTKKWDATKRSDPPGGPWLTAHLTSAWAFDWNGDGALDLLLGDHKSGYLFLRMNEGTNAAPKFAVVNTPVFVDGKPLVVPGTVTTPRLVDWDGDGRLDLVVGSMGDAYSGGPGGGIYLYRNIGTAKLPKFAAPIVLVEPSAKGSVDGPERPDAGLYMDVADIDGDGDLDLIVGGYSMWHPKPPDLSASQKARVPAVQKEIAALDAKSQAIYDDVDKAMKGVAEADADAKRTELYRARSAELQGLQKQRQPLQQELETLTGGDKRMSYVWVYENLTVKKGAAKAKSQ